MDETSGFRSKIESLLWTQVQNGKEPILLGSYGMSMPRYLPRAASRKSATSGPVRR
jgi:hypothetical protein